MRFAEFHPKTPAEARALLHHYESISPKLGDAFWAELLTALDRAKEEPDSHHFDSTGLRRSNLKRFPVHFLFRVKSDRIRITVIRHNRRNPDYGSKRS